MGKEFKTEDKNGPNWFLELWGHRFPQIHVYQTTTPMPCCGHIADNMDVLKGKVPGSNWVNRPKVHADNDANVVFLSHSSLDPPQPSEQFQQLKNDPLVRMKAAKEM